MASTKILHFTDVHLLDHNPPSRLGNYRQDILDKLRRIGEIGRESLVSAYTCGGDWFHEKVPVKTSHSLVYELMSVLKSYRAPCYTILGNHDVRFDRTSTYPEQPVGVLLNSASIVFQNDKIVQGPDSGHPSIRLAGFDFAEQPDLPSLALSATDKGKADYHVLSLHVYASERGGSIHGKAKVFSYAELLPLGYDVILLGHYHADQGVTILSREDGSTCHFVNIGSLSRGDYGDEQLTRIPKCCLLSFSPDGIEFVEIPVGAKPASEVFDLQKKEAIKVQLKQASDFVEKLESSDVVLSSGEDPVAALQSLNVDDNEVLEATKKFILQATAILQGNRQ